MDFVERGVMLRYRIDGGLWTEELVDELSDIHLSTPTS